MLRRTFLASVAATAIQTPVCAGSFSMVQVGNTSTSQSGWTTVLPTGTPQAPSGVGAGSRQIFVSNSTGNNGNAGTIAAPFKTIQFACGSLRSGKSDQLFLACGDTFPLSDATDIGFLDLIPPGASSGPVRTASNLNSDLTTSGPILIGSYQIPAAISTARPVVQVTQALSNPTAIGAKLVAGQCDKVVIQGIEFYCPKRDPGNAAYTYAEASSTNGPTGLEHTQSVTYILVEDCFFHFFDTNCIGFQTTNNMPSNAININRCIVSDSYNASGGNSQGLFANVAGATGGYNSNVANLTNSVFDQGGWNQVLTTPANATYSGNVFTWPSTLKFGNNATVFCLSGGGSSITTGTPFHVVATSGNTFSLSATQGGAALSTAGLPNPATLVWSDAQASNQNRNLYMDPPYTILNCITSNSAAEGFNARQGGTFLKNLSFRNTNHAIGDIVDGFSTISSFEFGFNVILSATNIQSIPAIQSRGGGLFIANTIASGGSATIHDNIIANWAGTGGEAAIEIDDNGGVATGGVGGVVTSNNIIWGTGLGFNGNGYQDDPGNAANGHINTISGNTFDAPKNNNLGGLEPFNTTAAAHTVADYSLSIGGAGTEADFLAKAKANSRLGGWDVRYTANPVVNYVRAGFGLTSV